MASDNEFELSSNIEHYLSVLSKIYQQDGHRQKQEIIVNAQVRMHEAWSFDNWNGGTSGHALFLTLPEPLFLAIAKKKNKLQEEIKSDINKIHNVRNEFIDTVFIEMEPSSDPDWRKDSGLLQTGKRFIPPVAAGRIWDGNKFRLFLSHKAEVKSETGELKRQLEIFGISAFVAHEDIHPTKEWQQEIENALHSMEAFVALLTAKFHESDWTDQEVGYALCRGVPIIAAKLERNPYGFIGRFQALSCRWDNAAVEIAKLLITTPRMMDCYLTALTSCSDFESANTLAEVLPEIQAVTDNEVERLIRAFNENPQVSGSYGFKGSWPSRHGFGLPLHLTRLTGRQYILVNDQIQVRP